MSFLEILQDQNPWWTDGATRRARRFGVRRDLQPRILAQVQRLSDRRAVVVLGPRQVGKTVALLQVADDLLAAGWPPQNLTYFDFSDHRIVQPLTPREVVDAKAVGSDRDHPRALLLDEVGRAGAWDRWLKQAVDAGGHRIVVTDSAATLLRQGGRESGQGRWDEFLIEGLSFAEFVRLHGARTESVDEALRRFPNVLERFLALGGFPEHALSDDFPEARARIRSDIVDRAILRDLSPLALDVRRARDLFVYLVQDSGAEFTAEARGSDLAADPRTVRVWKDLLTETLLLAELERSTRQPSARIRSKVKIFAADHGLVQAFALSRREERLRARVFEAAVFRHLREVVQQLGGALTYFRSPAGEELDFVVELNDAVVGIEVTSSGRRRPEKLAEVERAGKALGADRLLLVHGGSVEEPERQSGARPISLTRFLLDTASVIQGEQR
ncbi:MAG TPA: AAA family ATPase [Thermoanaerobaculia bacterium]|nr:AAA family ATPase [Thermoanaerobaculia bacterium]